jgi:hypothetical protein
MSGCARGRFFRSDSHRRLVSSSKHEFAFFGRACQSLISPSFSPGWRPAPRRQDDRGIALPLSGISLSPWTSVPAGR